jgi:hypothetical protein
MLHVLVSLELALVPCTVNHIMRGGMEVHICIYVVSIDDGWDSCRETMNPHAQTNQSQVW